MKGSTIPPLSVNLGGKKYTLELSMQGIYLAQRVHKFNLFKAIKQIDESSIAEMLELIWVAALHHHPTLMLKSFLESIGFNEMEELAKAIEYVTSVYLPPKEEKEEAKEASAKKRRTRSTSSSSKKSVSE